MRIVVLGAGALGSFIGAKLSQKHDVALVCRSEQVTAIEAAGLRVTGETQLVAHPEVTSDPLDVDTPDLLVIAVKAYDTEAAIKGALPLIGPTTSVMSLQNGLNNIEVLVKYAGEGRTFGGVTTHGITYLEPGHVHHAGRGYTYLGPLIRQSKSWASDYVSAFTECGIPAEYTENLVGEIWAKAIVNSGINPITAITGLKNGELLSNALLKELMERAVKEGVTVADGIGVGLPRVDLLERTREVARRTRDNKSSMLQDIERGRRTEIDEIVGKLCEYGRNVKAETPTLRTLHALVKGIEASTKKD
ncbi:MAG: 2-dehydropantoate 2-reductase [Euryarchaeota archaeon]|nr:2-dehydropantoate 2-reductase [Euryarchaeota archaeon]